MAETQMQTAQDVLKAKKSRIVSISSDGSVFEAIQTMVKRKVGAILVKKKEKIIGIWTERDLLRNLLEPDFDPRKAKMEAYMISPVISVPFDTPLIKLQEMFLGLYIRHILVQKDHQYLGLLSIGDVVRANLLKKDEEVKALNAIAGWEYYENWGWHRKLARKKNNKKRKK
jgi:signal-transduction protein with cAMP-binding, CBS, and nucleotidyltransferase domain